MTRRAKARHAVTTKSCEPQKRDRKAEHARSTDGRGCPRCGCPEFRLVRDPQRRLFEK
jgi:hypothetical protein